MKVQIFIDGGNFHHLALRPLGLKEKEFDLVEAIIFDQHNHLLAEVMSSGCLLRATFASL